MVLHAPAVGVGRAGHLRRRQLVERVVQFRPGAADFVEQRIPGQHVEVGHGSFS